VYKLQGSWQENYEMDKKKYQVAGLVREKKKLFHEQFMNDAVLTRGSIQWRAELTHPISPGICGANGTKTQPQLRGKTTRDLGRMLI